MTDDKEEYGDTPFERWMFRHETVIRWIMATTTGFVFGFLMGLLL